jgi:hypothetical protein
MNKLITPLVLALLVFTENNTQAKQPEDLSEINKQIQLLRDKSICKEDNSFVNIAKLGDEYIVQDCTFIKSGGVDIIRVWDVEVDKVGKIKGIAESGIRFSQFPLSLDMKEFLSRGIIARAWDLRHPPEHCTEMNFPYQDLEEMYTTTDKFKLFDKFKEWSKIASEKKPSSFKKFFDGREFGAEYDKKPGWVFIWNPTAPQPATVLYVKSDELFRFANVCVNGPYTIEAMEFYKMAYESFVSYREAAPDLIKKLNEKGAAQSDLFK